MGAGRTSTTERDFAHPGGDDNHVAGLADLLVASLEILAKAGQADAACRAAGKACAVLRQAHPAQWRKFNALLHRLSGQVRLDER
ncbi:hypothetical protein [Mesorhizobium sp. ES1-4]|uniref:hypothetical protein n=1 Tax=Mesorhizobium sp. ES1-4 TaxID=2876627 RepID=UPI001CCF4A42|nr:hypothetical protein [Mesorhizobium sp. ES1-4]MBZ9798679.1 hypothetical protein [Mesorhizobium sp. ES1-4]